MRPSFVYVAGPYTKPDPVENTREAIRIGMAIHDACEVAVEIPHLTLFAHFLDPRPIDYWYQFDLTKLAHCNVLWRMKGESHGADREVEAAKERGLRVFYEALNEWDDLINFCKGLSR